MVFKRHLRLGADFVTSVAMWAEIAQSSNDCRRCRWMQHATQSTIGGHESVHLWFSGRARLRCAVSCSKVEPLAYHTVMRPLPLSGHRLPIGATREAPRLDTHRVTRCLACEAWPTGMDSTNSVWDAVLVSPLVSAGDIAQGGSKVRRMTETMLSAHDAQRPHIASRRSRQASAAARTSQWPCLKLGSCWRQCGKHRTKFGKHRLGALDQTLAGLDQHVPKLARSSPILDHLFVCRNCPVSANRCPKTTHSGIWRESGDTSATSVVGIGLTGRIWGQALILRR